MGMASEQSIAAGERGYEYICDMTICVDHIADPYLHEHAGEPSESSCSFCPRTEDAPFAVSLRGVQETFMTAFWNHYGRADDAPYWDGGYHGLEDTGFAVAELAMEAFEPDVVDDVATALTDAIGDLDVSTWFTRMDTDDLELNWSAFEKTAKHVSRFIVPDDETGRSPMARVSSFLRQLLMYVEGEHSLVRTMKPGSIVYRGRPIESVKGEIFATAEALGPAPERRAAANRMSPAGIPMFYCSADAVTAVAEIAVHDVKPFAVIGEFTCCRPLRISDLTRVRTRPSSFDPDHLADARMLSFLDQFADDLSRPVIADERQHVEYAPTQVLTEYFRWMPENKIDGIEMRSSQTGASTYVLFTSASEIVNVNVDEATTPPLRGVGADFFEEEPEGPAFTFDPAAVVAYEVNRKVEPAPVARRTEAEWIITSPSRAR